MKRRFITEKDKQKMRDLEEAGKSRKEIADELDVDPATVTRHLGSLRTYRWLRVKAA